MSSQVQPYHISVLVNEVVQYLNPQPGKVYVDATFGGGGHTKAILDAQKDCRVIALDWDTKALEMNGESLQEEYGDRLTLVWGNFTRLDHHLKQLGISSVDGILADFGTSQYQLKERDGFSFASDTPLDMRMSPGHQKMTAAHVLNSATEKELADIFFEYGQEDKARAIAKVIVTERARKQLRTTGDLVHCVNRVYGGTERKRTHFATKTFQALRIYINRELDNISAFLPAALRSLSKDGNLLCITFHSLEDRIVKQWYVDQARYGILEVVTPKGVVAGEDELLKNPSARSARLRVAKKLIKQ